MHTHLHTHLHMLMRRASTHAYACVAHPPPPSRSHATGSALNFRGDARAATVPESAHRAAFAFSSVLMAAGSGTASVRDALNAAIAEENAPVASKAVAKFISQPRAGEADGAMLNPIHALRKV